MTSQDESEIRSLLCRERYSRDTCQWNKLRDSYHPDPSKTWINITWYKGDIDGFVSGSEKLTSKSVSIIHLIVPSEIDVRGSKALCESVGMITARFQHEGHDYDLTNWVRFVSRAEKVESRWKLLTLEVIYVRDGIAAVGNAPTPDFGEVNGWPRKSYRFLAWHLGARGVKVREDLPGADDEESVNEVMDRNRGWIDAE